MTYVLITASDGLDPTMPRGDLLTDRAGVDAVKAKLCMAVGPSPTLRSKQALTFKLDEASTGAKKAVKKKHDDASTVVLYVDAQVDRIITLTLCAEWDWKFVSDPVRVTSGDSRNYGVVWKDDSTIEVHAHATGKNPKPGEEGQDDKLDILVSLKQDGGRDVIIAIDPITENPPPSGPKDYPLSGPQPIA